MQVIRLLHKWFIWQLFKLTLGKVGSLLIIYHFVLTDRRTGWKSECQYERTLLQVKRLGRSEVCDSGCCKLLHELKLIFEYDKRSEWIWKDKEMFMCVCYILTIQNVPATIGDRQVKVQVKGCALSPVDVRVSYYWWWLSKCVIQSLQWAYCTTALRITHMLPQQLYVYY